jgi:hypothetical protein
LLSKFAGAIGLVAVLATPALAQPEVSFGDNEGEYARDAECDDPRFEGPGMTATSLLSDDILHDAGDCKAAFDAGHLTLRGVDTKGKVNFGDDTGEYVMDGECDDMRFTGPGMTATALLEDDMLPDASDCRDAYKAGSITLNLE